MSPAGLCNVCFKEIRRGRRCAHHPAEARGVAEPFIARHPRSMDPLTAWAQAVKAVAELLLEVVKGQPADVKAKQWERFEAFQTRWEKVFKIGLP